MSSYDCVVVFVALEVVLRLGSFFAFFVYNLPCLLTEFLYYEHLFLQMLRTA